MFDDQPTANPNRDHQIQNPVTAASSIDQKQRLKNPRPKLAVYKFASCDGCQLSLLGIEEKLLQLAGRVEIAYFLEATSRIQPGPYDVGIVEGSVTTTEDVERIRRIRNDCRYLITIGACATAGGIQALRNWADIDDFVTQVYASPQYIQTLAHSTPISRHVPVDFELRGCPINSDQLLTVVGDLLADRRPSVPRDSVCIECKRQETVCIAVAQGVACLGPVTHAGCGAICPSFNRECFGCFGPKPVPNLVSLTAHYQREGHPDSQLVNLVRSFNAYAQEFRDIEETLTQNRFGR